MSKQQTPTPIPTSFDVQALAKAIVQNAAVLAEMSDHDPQVAVFRHRQAGLCEAWAIMTMTQEEMFHARATVTPQKFLADLLDRCLVVAADFPRYTATI